MPHKNRHSVQVEQKGAWIELYRAERIEYRNRADGELIAASGNKKRALQPR